ncbi:hypothetical protein TRAPUB_7798 [Trametes pubescens]|uniref:Uncharacterized protein n=1 Tax=Trametes pubescens TaxID=154538 RepID=A0A1M2V2C2_TRAPU|nr:hypothetical protein TRAPUB_7798 [Trametes pubescens]
MVNATPKPPAGSLPTHPSFLVQARSRLSFKLRRKVSKPVPGKPTSEERVFHDLTSATSPQQHAGDAEDPSAEPVKVPSPLIASLVPLPFAQQRRDIRERREGFEMSGGSPTPFAIRAQTLLPLNVAFEREDIRRRHERFESPKTISHTSILSTTPVAGADTFGLGLGLSPDRTARRSAALSISASHPQAGHSCSIDSAPSIYSPTRNYIDPSAIDQSTAAEESWSYDSLVAVYSSENSCSDDCSGDAGNVQMMLENLTSSSFDEESFIRMAEDCVGW